MSQTRERFAGAIAAEPAEPSDNGSQMKIGWMWFDNDPKRSLAEKVERAAERYRAKFGRWPRLCYVNRRAVDGDGFVCGKVKVVAAPNVLPHHFWLGSGNGKEP